MMDPTNDALPACPDCGGALVPCGLGDPDVHCETCRAVIPLDRDGRPDLARHRAMRAKLARMR